AASAAVLAACLSDVSPAGVVDSIKPVHSLLAAVMEGVRTPPLIVRGAGSEHVHSLRPSDAEALEKASVVFRVGEGMETFLNGPLKTLAAGARVVSLEDAPDLETLAFREGGPFEAHAHGEGHDRDDGDAHESEGHGHDHDHDRDAHDLHIWLDPLNARAMVAEIARVLAEADPGNAMRYLANAQAYSA